MPKVEAIFRFDRAKYCRMKEESHRLSQITRILDPIMGEQIMMTQCGCRFKLKLFYDKEMVKD